MSKLRRPLILLAIVVLLGFIATKVRELLRAKAGGPATIASRVKEFGPIVKSRLLPYFQRAVVPYPPARVVLVGFKQERQLEVYAAGSSGALKFIRSYQIKAASGSLGPKLREGDCQVPEGIYKIEYLNPNSSYHLSMKLDYPNAFDRKHGAEDGRQQLGGDIMIHGSFVSAGCLAMGDEVAEDLFVLAALTGIKNVSVIVSPVDFRTREMPPLPRNATPQPAWTPTLYSQLREALKNLPRH